jgi:hypothetical protein
VNTRPPRNEHEPGSGPRPRKLDGSARSGLGTQTRLHVCATRQNRVAAGQEPSQVRRKLGSVTVTAHAGRTLEQQAKDAITW